MILSIVSVNFLVLIIGISSWWHIINIDSQSEMVNKTLNETENATETHQQHVAEFFSIATPIGIAVGAILGGICSDFIGRKSTFLLTCTIHVLFYFHLCFAKHWLRFHIARITSAATLGVVNSVVPVYSAEVAAPKNRGKFGCIFSIFIGIGMSVAPIMDELLSIAYWHAFVVAVGIQIFIVIYFFAEESPDFLMRQRKSPQKTDIGNRYPPMAAGIRTENYKRMVYSKARFKAMMIICVLFYILTVAKWQFHALTNALFGHWNVKIQTRTIYYSIGIVKILSSTVCFSIIDVIGRKNCLYLSGILSGITIFLIGTLHLVAGSTQLFDMYTNHTTLLILPLTLILFLLFLGIGIGAVPFVLIGEILPFEYKGTFSGLIIGFSWMLELTLTSIDQMLVLEPYVNASVLLGMRCLIFIFSLSLLRFCYLETDGLSLEEIQDRLEGEKEEPNNTNCIPIRYIARDVNTIM